MRQHSSESDCLLGVVKTIDLKTEMKTLFLIIALLLSCSQLMSKSIAANIEVVLVFDSQENNQDSGSKLDWDSDDSEIEFITTKCSPVFAFSDRGETIYTDTINLKSNFYFCLWRPPRI